jgi:hypothetical protein
LLQEYMPDAQDPHPGQALERILVGGEPGQDDVPPGDRGPGVQQAGSGSALADQLRCGGQVMRASRYYRRKRDRDK